MHGSFVVLCVKGAGLNTVYCGDGINDIAALAGADVGVAVGATDAVVAASLSTAQKPAAGVGRVHRAAGV